MQIDSELLNILVCPACREPVDPRGDEGLACRGCGRIYPIRDGIPVMLVNARLSPRSEARFRYFRPLVRHFFEDLDAVLVQYAEDVERWKALGAVEERVRQVLESKRALFDGLLVEEVDQVVLDRQGRSSLVERVRTLLEAEARED